MPTFVASGVSNGLGAITHADDIVLGAQRATRHPRHHSKAAPASNVDDVARQATATAEGPALADKLIGTGLGVMGTAGTAAFFGPGILGGIGRLINWTGTKLNIGFLRNTGQAILRPVKYVDSTSTAEFGQYLGVGDAVGRVTTPAFNGTATATNWVSNKTGLGARKRGTHLGKMHRQLEEAQRLLPAVDMNALHADIRPHFEQMHSVLNSGLNTGLIDMQHLTHAHGEYRTAVAQLSQKDPTAAIVAKAGAKKLAKLESAVGNAVTHHHAAEGWKNPGKPIKGLPQEIGGSSIRNTVMQGTWIGASALSLVATARGFLHDVTNLKKMHADITGKPVSTLGLFLGSVPAPVATARKHLLKNFLAREAVETVGLVATVKQAKGGHINPLTIGVQMFGSQGVDMILGNSLLDAYTQFNEMYKTGQPIPAEYYAVFLGAVSDELNSRGGSSSKFTQAIAEQYAAQKVSPAQIMNEINSGKLMQRVHNLIDANSGQNPTATAAHVEKLNGAKERPVVGKHTEQLNRPVSQPEQGLGPIVS